MPSNISEWWDAKLEGDPRWRYGTPLRRRKELEEAGRWASQRSNANFT